MPSVEACFMIESQHCADLRITKFLLRNGATADFGAFYEIVKDHDDCNADLVTASFAKLCLLSGCTFSEYFVMLMQEKEQGPAGQDHLAKRVRASQRSLLTAADTTGAEHHGHKKSIGRRQL